MGTLIAAAVTGIGAGHIGAEAATPAQLPQAPTVSAPALTTADIVDLRKSIDAVGAQVSASELRLTEKISGVDLRVGRLEGARDAERRR